MASEIHLSFWEFVAERADIWHRKEILREPPPWTDDPILAVYRFTNVRRADDTGTIWYVKNVVHFTDNWASLLWRTMVYRKVNNVAWFEDLDQVPSLSYWREYRELAIANMRRCPPPYSPAYVVLAHRKGSRTNTLINDLDLAEKGWDQFANHVQLAGYDSAKRAHQILTELNGIGGFLAYQILRDLILARRVPFNDNDFTHIGPGAAYTLRHLSGETHYDRQYDFLLGLWHRQPPLRVMSPLCLGDVENCLCEYGKYVKISQGGGRRRKYRHAIKFSQFN